MPYRNIYEKDYTRATPAQYSNFAVLVPGFVDDVKVAALTEDDYFNYMTGVFEFNTQSDFVSKVGKVITKTIGASEAVAPELDEVNDDYYDDSVEGESTLVGLTWEKLSNEVKARIDNHESYLVTFTAKTESQKVGHLVDENYAYKIVPVIELPRVEETDQIQYGPEGDEPGVTKYVVLSNQGQDEVKGHEATHYGNQIAYELLGLGYQVLYKVLDDPVDLNSYSFYEDLEDKSIYNFRFILTGLREDNVTANNQIAQLAKTRNDCIALLDLDESRYMTGIKSQTDLFGSIKGNIDSLTYSDTYSTILGPSLKLKMDEDEIYQNKTFPMSLYYLACAKYALENNYKEWYAVAGYRRGICRYTIDAPLVKIGESLVNKLAPRRQTNGSPSRACNLVALIKGNYYIWGNRTAETLQSGDTGDLTAKHYLNIRQLITTLKKELYVILTSKTFNPNSDTLWYSFKSSVTPILETMVSTDGIADYDIVRVENAQKGTMSAVIRLVPIEAVEDFEITISLEDSLEETATILE